MSEARMPFDWKHSEKCLTGASKDKCICWPPARVTAPAWTEETKARLRKTTFADDFRADVDTAIARIEELEREVERLKYAVGAREALWVIDELRSELAVAGVAGSPPPGRQGTIPDLRAALAAEREAHEQTKAEVVFHHAALVRVAEAVGVTEPLQLIALAENNDETYVDLLIKHISASAEREVERLKGAKDDADRSRDDAIGRCVEAQREVERLKVENAADRVRLGLIAEDYKKRADVAERENERLKAFVKQKEEARASAAGALSREMGRANAAEANAAALQDVVDGALKNEQKERNRAITAEGKLAEAQVVNMRALHAAYALTPDCHTIEEAVTSLNELITGARLALAAEREAHEQTKQAITEAINKLEAGTLHRLVCNADHSKPTGGDMCICNPLKTELHHERERVRKLQEEAESPETEP